MVRAALGRLWRRLRPAAPAPLSQAELAALGRCPWCGGYHPFACPWVARLVLDPSGRREVVLRPQFYRDFAPRVLFGGGAGAGEPQEE
jgi:hypothetical protein